MLNELCKELNNYFVAEKHFGKFKIVNGNIAPLDFIENGQYFAIFDSKFNDGVYRYPASGLTDEEFNGAIWAMAVPSSVVALAKQIEEYNNSEPSKPSAFTSESFGGYSYSRATESNGAPLSWQSVFAKQLKAYRKIRP